MHDSFNNRLGLTQGAPRRRFQYCALSFQLVITPQITPYPDMFTNATLSSFCNIYIASQTEKKLIFSVPETKFSVFHKPAEQDPSLFSVHGVIRI
jgi:hypothetical protein